jgi:arylsulfatase A-like enzyme
MIPAGAPIVMRHHENQQDESTFLHHFLQKYERVAAESPVNKVGFLPICVQMLLCLGLVNMIPLTSQAASAKPNIVLIMADDLGWSDVGFNGNSVVQTPQLDAMASNGLVFDRFYAAAPVCSPTRGSCLTGRHPYRYGIPTANAGHMLPEEVTLAEILKEQGYATGHFGKWHLGTLTKEGKDSNRGGDRNQQHYAPPTEHGFDTYFSTEAKVPTWDSQWAPPKHGGKWWDPVAPTKRKSYGTSYWTPDGRVDEALEGDDSKVIMDRAVEFIEGTVKAEQPFFTVVWFHAPHLPVVSGKRWTDLYATLGGYHRNYYGCISALDHQVGRLRAKLDELGVKKNTMVWFCADNGPEGQSFSAPGSAWPLSGRKRSLREGGIRVPGILEWPAMVSGGGRTNVPAVTSDYLPTIVEMLGTSLPDRPVDGMSLIPVIAGKSNERLKAIETRKLGFQSAKQFAWMHGSLKYYSPDMGETDFLFDLNSDISESSNLAQKRPEALRIMKLAFLDWRQSCVDSANGEDY